MKDSTKNNATYTHIETPKIAVRYAQNLEYSVDSRNTSTAPQIAVALYAISSSRVNSLASRS